MLDLIWNKIKKIISSRLFLVAVVYVVLSLILVTKLYQIQILHAEQVIREEEFKTVRERTTGTTRGLIYDSQNRILAYNELSYSVVLEDSPLLDTNDKKNEMLFRMLSILKKYDIKAEPEFGISLGESGILEYNLEGTARLRFIKNALGKQSVDNLTQSETELTAEELFSILRHGSPALGAMYGISDQYTVSEALEIMAIRYAIFTLWPKYSQILIATDIPDDAIISLRESSKELPGVSVVMQTKRVYNYSEYFAHLIGYTGKISEEELEEYNSEKEIYSATDAIGKTGIEKSFESVLRGEKGIEKLTLDSNYRIIDTEMMKKPEAGNNIHLTIDAEQQKAYYYLLEKELAQILLKQMTDKLDYGTKGTNADNILIPVYEVYDALFSNNVLSVQKAFLEAPNGNSTDNETTIYYNFCDKRAILNEKLKNYLVYGSSYTPGRLTKEINEYMDYIYKKVTSASFNLLPIENIDKKDPFYIDYQNGKKSLAEFLIYAINTGRMNYDLLKVNDYMTSEEIYERALTLIFDSLKDDPVFLKLILRNMIFNSELTGKQICLLLFDQDVLEYDEDDYNRLVRGNISAYNFIRKKIERTEITPAQLALEPCGGSIIITDVNGNVKVMVTYPSYDNNKLANKIDWDYYSGLLNDKSNPLSSRITNAKTTTGSTFKMLTSFAGYGENKITLNEKIEDEGIFKKVDPSPSCWYYPHKHGLVDVSTAILHSCNYFYFEVGYRLSLDSKGEYSDSLGISKIRKYAEMFGLGQTSGIEVAELPPQISDHDAVRTAIGYYHSFTPSQIARYVTTLANRGSCYNLTLLDSITDKDNRVLKKNSAVIFNRITEFSDAEWNKVQNGMYLVLNSNDSTGKLYNKLDFEVAGKSGTAQVSDSKPSHVLFVSYAPYKNPEIAVTIVIPNGYSSGYPTEFGYTVYDYYFNPETYDVFYDKIETEE